MSLILWFEEEDIYRIQSLLKQDTVSEIDNTLTKIEGYREMITSTMICTQISFEDFIRLDDWGVLNLN